MSEFVRATIVEGDYERGYKDGRDAWGEISAEHWDYVIALEQKVEKLEGQKDALHVKIWKVWRMIWQMREE